jgi:hypothetical protein
VASSTSIVLSGVNAFVTVFSGSDCAVHCAPAVQNLKLMAGCGGGSKMISRASIAISVMTHSHGPGALSGTAFKLTNGENATSAPMPQWRSAAVSSKAIQVQAFDSES